MKTSFKRWFDLYNTIYRRGFDFTNKC